MGGYLNPIGFQNTTDPRKIAANQRALVWGKGDVLNQEATDQAGEAGASRNAYLDTTNDIENQYLSGQGGYNADEAAAIRGDTGSYSRYFDPQQMSANVQAGQQAQQGAVSQMQEGLNSAIDPNALSQSQGYRDTMNQSLTSEGQDMGNAVQNMGENMGQGLLNEQSQLNAAVDPSKLGLSSGFTNNYLMSPEEQQNIVTGAGISAGLKDSQAVGDLNRAAAAAGTDPMGVAAYRARMGRQQAADAGDAMTQARIGASNAAAQRQQTNESMRLGAQQDIASRQQQNAQTIGQQGIAAQADWTKTGLAARESWAQQQQAAANQAEINRQNTQQYITGAKMNAAATGGQAALQNAQTSTGQTMQQQQYNTNTGTGITQAQDAANSQRAAGIANQRINQQNLALSNQNQKAGMFNQNQQGAYGRQQQTYATQAGASNQAAQQGLAASQTPSTFDKIAAAGAGAIGAAAKAGYIDEGDVVTQPSLRVLGENGPEAVVPYRSRLQKAIGAAGGALAAGAGGPGAAGQPPRPNPYAQLAQAGADVANAYRARKRIGKMDQQMSSALQDYNAQNPTQVPPYQGNANVQPMAEGRVVTKPTLALLGEKEPEAVVPLGFRSRARVRPSSLIA